MDPFPLLPVSAAPFPHVLADDWLEPALYAALCASFPECPAATGPTGYTLHWGDPEYNALIAGNAAWHALFERFQSQAFVDYALRQFEAVFRSEGGVDLSEARFIRHCETRAEKERGAPPSPPQDADRLWVRVDIMQGRTGYTREAHLDHRRRAVSLLLYFCDAQKNAMVGGDLVLHGPGGETLSIPPRHNRMAMFPCHNQSFHSVSPILSQARPRNFVQVQLSSSSDLWPPVRPALPVRIGRRIGRLLAPA